MSHITRGRPLGEDDYCMNCHQLHYDCQCVHQTAGRKKKMGIPVLNDDGYPSLTEGKTRGGMSSKKKTSKRRPKKAPLAPKTKRELNRREGPVWKEVMEKKPFCPKCGSEMRRTRGDAATMFDWECWNPRCYYVC
jgi:hypothetical protein